MQASTIGKWALSFVVGALVLWLGWKVPIVLLIFHVCVCFVLAIVVLLQSGSAADLAGAFGGAGSQTAFGPRGAATILSKATTWCAVMFMLTSLLLVVRQDIRVGTGHSVLENYSKPASSKPTTPPPTQPQPQLPNNPPPQQPH
ncbi:MAG TPA: preprotein translocase subunit SecG [Candidatus Acidoferrales bacterium]|nr:preprotein translocase subunit SecG [Candidatus Acidoferrales bacterium]